MKILAPNGENWPTDEDPRNIFEFVPHPLDGKNFYQQSNSNWELHHIHVISIIFTCLKWSNIVIVTVKYRFHFIKLALFRHQIKICHSY